MFAKRVFKSAVARCSGYGYWPINLRNFGIYGILRELSDEVLLSKGLTYYLEIRAVSYDGHNNMWGEFGVGFEGLERFDEE